MWDELLQVRGLYVLRSDTLAHLLSVLLFVELDQATMSRTGPQSSSGTHLWRLSCLCKTTRRYKKTNCGVV